jgi:predicted HicB family RNase H-like nuclease
MVPLQEGGLPRMKKAETIQSTMRLSKSLWKTINRIAAKQDLSMQQVVNRALREYVARERRK